jgi:RNA polymerase sigma-70 factor (ECF subfamily)
MSDSSSSHRNGAASPGDSPVLAHCRWLRTVLVARSGDLDATDDLLQEVLLAAEKNCRNGHPPDDLRPWLYRVAVRQALLHRRKLGRRRRALKQKQVQNRTRPETAKRTPLDWLLQRERQQMVRTALTQLAPKDAEILLLKYSENWSYRQISEHLGLSLSAVEGRLHRARQRMRTELTAMNFDETER